MIRTIQALFSFPSVKTNSQEASSYLDAKVQNGASIVFNQSLNLDRLQSALSAANLASIYDLNPDKKTLLKVSFEQKDQNLFNLLLDHGAQLDETTTNDKEFIKMQKIWERPQYHKEFQNLFNESDLINILADFHTNKIETDVVDFFNTHGFKSIFQTNHDGIYPIRKACSEGYYNIAQKLIESGALAVFDKIDSHPYFPLQLACENEHLMIVQLLIEKAPRQLLTKTDYNQDSGLSIACLKGNYQIAKILVEKLGPDCLNQPNDQAETPLFQAISSGNYGLVELLLSKGAQPSINIPDIFADTPLFYACKKGDSRTVKLLIDHGASLGDLDGTQCLKEACEKGHYGIVRVLLKNGLPIKEELEVYFLRDPKLDQIRHLQRKGQRKGRKE